MAAPRKHDKAYDEELKLRVERIDKFGEGLTKWEVEFIASLIDKNVESFSPKQAEIIERICRDRC